MKTEPRASLSTEKTYKWFAVTAVNLVHCFSHLNSQGVSILYPVLREHFSFGYTGIAILTLVKQVVEGPMQLTYGVLTRFVSRIRLMAIGTIVAFLGVTGMAVSQSFAQLVASRMLRGLGTSPNHPVGGAILVDSFKDARSRAFAFYQTSGNAGGLLAPLVVGGLLYFIEWRLVIFILGLPLVIASIMLFSIRKPVRYAGTDVATKRRPGLGLSEYKAVFKDRNAMLVALVMMVGAAGRGTGSLNTYLAAILVDRFGVSPSFAAVFVAAYLFGGLAGPLLLGWIADRTSPRLILSITLAFSAVFVLLILMPHTPGILLFMITFLTGFFVYPRSSLTLSMLVSVIPDDTRVDTLLSVYHTMSAITGPAWIFITGFLVDKFGLAAALCVMASSYITGILILNLIRPAPTKPLNAVTA